MISYNEIEELTQEYQEDLNRSPNSKTQAVIDSTDRGENLCNYENVEALFKDLDIKSK